VIEYDQAQLVWGNGGQEKVKGEREPTPLERAMMSPMTINTRKPNHAWHYTRNVRILSEGMATEAIVKIHPPLIIEFNGQTTTP
jgi:hypothetical protein